MSEDVKRAIGAKYDLPDALSDRLVGETAEELDADARSLARLTHTPESLSGGLDPHDEHDDFDPVEAMYRHRAASRASLQF
ncbi:hypothetical protein [Streptomyces hirsutus]|uniref:hypothetical protein n=1 Tax=Streptomyces hirsutus TaxID=35620 RepID=UPI00332DAE15